MAAELGTDEGTVAALVLRHPQLLPASSHMQRSLQLLQQLLLLAAASEQSGFGAGIAAAVQDAAGRHEQQALQQYRSVSQAVQPEAAPQQLQQQAALLTPADIGAAARQLALSHPQLLLTPPEALQLRMAALQARTGLSAAHVAALLVSQPQLLMEEAPPAAAAAGHRHRRRRDHRQRRLAPG
jgi:hypothetical protein